MKAFGEAQRNWAGFVAIATLFVLALAAPLVLDGRGSTGAIQTSVVQAATRDRFEVADPLRLVAVPAITIERGTISFRHASGSRLSSAGAMLAILRGGTAELVIEDATLALDDNTLPPPPPDTVDALAAPIVEALSKLAFSNVKLARCRLVLASRSGAPIVLEDLETSVSLVRRSARTARGSFMFRGEAVAFDLTLGAETAEGDKAPLSGTIKGRHVDAELRGLLRLDTLTLNASQARLDVPDLRRAVRWLGASWPDGPAVSSLSLRGELEWSRRAIAFQNATISIDGKEAKGGLALNTSGPRPAIDGTMAFSQLDLAPYFTSRALDQKFSLSRLITWPDWIEPAPTLLVEQVDADLRLSSELVTFGDHPLGRGAATISLEQGRLLADVAELELGSGARGSGQLSIDFAPAAPPIAIKANLQQVDLGLLSQRLFGHPALRGRSNLTIDVAGSGRTSAEVVNNTRGHMLVRADKGAQLGADLRMLAATALSKELDGWGPAGKGQTTVDQLDAELMLSNGVLAFQNANAKAGATSLTATGWIGFGDASINLRLAVSRPPDQGALLDVAKDQAAVAANSSLIRIEGPWSRPRIRHVPPSDQAAEPPAGQAAPSGKRG